METVSRWNPRSGLSVLTPGKTETQDESWRKADDGARSGCAGEVVSTGRSPQVPKEQFPVLPSADRRKFTSLIGYFNLNFSVSKWLFHPRGAFGHFKIAPNFKGKPHPTPPQFLIISWIIEKGNRKRIVERKADLESSSWSCRYARLLGKS